MTLSHTFTIQNTKMSKLFHRKWENCSSEELRPPTCCAFYIHLQFDSSAVHTFCLLQNVHHHTNSREVQHWPRNARGKPWAQEIYLHILWRTTTTNLLRFLQISAVQSFSLLKNIHHHANSQDIPPKDNRLVALTLIAMKVFERIVVR